MLNKQKKRYIKDQVKSFMEKKMVLLGEVMVGYIQ